MSQPQRRDEIDLFVDDLLANPDRAEELKGKLRQTFGETATDRTTPEKRRAQLRHSEATRFAARAELRHADGRQPSGLDLVVFPHAAPPLRPRKDHRDRRRVAACGQGAWGTSDALDGIAAGQHRLERLAQRVRRAPGDEHEDVGPALRLQLRSEPLDVGGVEHAVLHLLYARFWHKVLYDLEIVSTDEPYTRLFNQGMILAFAYENEAGAKIPADQIEERDGRFYNGENGTEVRQIVAKMSKSLKNVVNPEDVTMRYGADSLRLYEMFMGPLESMKPWSTRGVEGITRFLDRVWRLMVGDEGSLSQAVTDAEPAPEQLRLLQYTIKKVTDDIDALRFNTAIAQMMVFTNEMTKLEQRPRRLLEPFVLLLLPFAPHLSEELWERLGQQPRAGQQPWPQFDPALVVSDRLTIPIQVNGKLRGKLEVDAGASREQLEPLAKKEVAEWLQGKEPKKVIYVEKKLINFVV